MAAGRVIARRRNPEGRVVELRADTWDHVLGRHPELAAFREDVMRSIEMPDHREPDPVPGRERFFRRGGPERWLRVVTELSGDVDRVVTVFPQVRAPAPGAGRR